MTKEKNIHIRIELGKDTISGNLTLLTYFNLDAPNFAKDEEGYYWLPTSEEKDFLNEAFELIPTTIPKTKISTAKETITKQPELKEEKIEKTEPPIDIEDKEPEKPSSPFTKKEKAYHLPPLEKNEETAVFEVTEEETKTEESKTDKETKDKEEEDEKIIVEADDQAIERALRKGEEKDETIVEVDEQTIVDRVLSQKKKGKWGRSH